MAVTGTAQPAIIQLQAYLGQADFTHQTAVDFNAPASLTATTLNQNTITITAATSYQAVNLTTLFPSVAAALFVSVLDITNPGQAFSFSTVNGSGNIAIAASSYISWMPNGGALGTIYLSNTAATAGFVQISVMSN